ncbi:MAG: tRNA uridine-5-carboxymethylaminomethyl(34) synthesis enzyme MnmG [Bacteroidales bacterium]|nr:tRNA uridine-5-carboxymethylaminomethyl(34) synthesis enzyme MnmG [Bacteroidales bacterium]MCM1146777.1 tRNA uridine-5-carboxymethylaminomethyl(34) synthesis enzyme MnmG [Bacteroidales bacterium]MCM1205726.1 tRNA uridine-5-carboxymethylaminomethyl(34) synthesis enzyme MnmG [Bacillota bacterium]MCM1510744.1 tRNA uridine-5-carboxymethylaminomethyl(34) synthesis enzyme MnmG [Clostridium sp.]
MILFYDVIVVGAGHAGCEAACASAGVGARTCLVTMDMNKTAQMSCNPAVGGIAKGQIVREVDALGGRMGIVTDRTAIQFRMLNRSKGPAMWSPRAQCDRGKFIWEWRHQLDITPNLDIWQDQVDGLLTENGHVCGVTTIWGVEIRAKSVVVTAGTFLNGLLHIGRKMLPGGRIAEPAATRLTESINSLGIRSARMKTGTPVRIDARSVHYEDMVRQDGEETDRMFSYLDSETFESQYPESRGNFALEHAGANEGAGGSVLPCWTTETNKRCHEKLLAGIADSPLYNGQIESIGPRYCPSVETKLMTFPGRDSHPLFLEPEGTDSNEMYLNGFSSSMPMEVQIEALREIPAFRDLKVYRPGYAIEYDFFDPTQLKHTLESKICGGLFFAGQVNGTTGYEEAAGQGLMAGLNAARLAGGSEGIVLSRDQAYIGVLIDDLVMKGVDEPYRMFTSRAEYRILLRQDDADRRLTPLSHSAGLATSVRMSRWLEKEKDINSLMELLHQTTVKPQEINSYLEEIGSTPLRGSYHLNDLLARPGVTIEGFIKHGILSDSNVHNLGFSVQKDSISHPSANSPKSEGQVKEVIEATEVMIKYDGYIRREREYAEKMHRLEDIKIRGNFDYNSLKSLSTEARQKLTARQPQTLAQASRIPGVSPSDINVLLVYMGR